MRNVRRRAQVLSVANPERRALAPRERSVEYARVRYCEEIGSVAGAPVLSRIREN